MSQKRKKATVKISLPPRPTGLKKTIRISLPPLQSVTPAPITQVAAAPAPAAAKTTQVILQQPQLAIAQPAPPYYPQQQNPNFIKDIPTTQQPPFAAPAQPLHKTPEKRNLDSKPETPKAKSNDKLFIMVLSCVAAAVTIACLILIIDIYYSV